MEYENILVERLGRVGLITLNRPKALNALSEGLVADVTAALDDFEADEGIGAVLLTVGKGFRGGRRPQGDFRRRLRGRIYEGPGALLGPRRGFQEADRGGSGRLCAGRRLRTRHDV